MDADLQQGLVVLGLLAALGLFWSFMLDGLFRGKFWNR